MIAIGKDRKRDRRGNWQDEFLKMLPEIEQYLSYVFRELRGDNRDDAIEEGIANCAVRYAGLSAQGRGHVCTAASLASYAALQVKSGRQVGCRMNVRDPLSRYAQVQKDITVERLDRYESKTSEWIQVMVEDRRTSIPDQVAFRIDVPAWLATLSRKARRIAEDLAMGTSTSEAARKHHVSPSRISQARRELYESWTEFCQDAGLCAPAGT
jgi:hypothetical protein